MRFFLRKASFYVFTAWAAITLNFFIPRWMKGDPISALQLKHPGAVSSESLESLRILFGVDTTTSVWQQYLDYWKLLLRGDLGVSISQYPASVSSIIAAALPWTIAMVGVATVLSFIIGTSLGTWIGWKRGSKAEILVPIATFFSTVPYFWLGLMALSVFAVGLGWFPASHAYAQGLTPQWSWQFVGSVLAHAALPAITIVISSLGGWILGMRNMMVTVLNEEYVTVAEAKGLTNWRVVTAYAARNAVLPQLSSFALSLGFVVSGALVTEMVFSYPGVGLMMLQATNAKDYPLMQGIFLVITLSVLAANIAADVVLGILDPRTRQEA